MRRRIPLIIGTAAVVALAGGAAIASAAPRATAPTPSAVSDATLAHARAMLAPPAATEGSPAA